MLLSEAAQDFLQDCDSVSLVCMSLISVQGKQMYTDSYGVCVWHPLVIKS